MLRNGCHRKVDNHDVGCAANIISITYFASKAHSPRRRRSPLPLSQVRHAASTPAPEAAQRRRLPTSPIPARPTSTSSEQQRFRRLRGLRQQCVGRVRPERERRISRQCERRLRGLRGIPSQRQWRLPRIQHRWGLSRLQRERGLLGIQCERWLPRLWQRKRRVPKLRAGRALRKPIRRVRPLNLDLDLDLDAGEARRGEATLLACRM